MSLRHCLLAGLATAALIGAAPPGQAAPAPRTLTEALALAYATNPTLLAERAKLRATDEDVPQALSGWRPQIVISGSGGYAEGDTRSVSALGSSVTPFSRDPLAVQAQLTQPLYRGGHTVASTNKAKDQVYGERATLLSTEQQVFGNVVTAYVTVIQDQQLVALNANNVQVLTQQLQATRDRFRVGELTQTDVAQAEAALAGAEAQLQTAQGSLQVARSSFQQSVGVLPGTLTPPQPLALPVKTAAQARREAALNNPQVVAAQFGDAAAKDAVDVAFSALMPQISLQAVAMRQDNQQITGYRQTAEEALLTLQVPIYQGGAEYATVRQAKQTEQQARKTVDEQRRAAIQLAAQAWETLAASRAAIVSTRAQIRANEVALVGVQREALLGTRTTLDVLNAEQTLLGSRQALIQNLAQSVTASYAVASAVGRLTARDLALPVALYDDTAYYRAVKNRLFGVDDEATSQPGR